jgi:hypothetical protein
VATADGTFSICGTFLVAGESLEAGVASALSALGLLLCQVSFLDEAAAMAGTELILTAAWALILTELAHEALLAVANWLKLVVHSTLTVARAQVLAFVTGAKEIALAAKEAGLALAFRNAFLAERAVALAGAHTDGVALAVAAGAGHCAVFAQEARVASAIGSLVRAVAAAHEQARFEVEGGIIVEGPLAAAVGALTLLPILARKQAVAGMAQELAFLSQELKGCGVLVRQSRLDANGSAEVEA